MCAVPVDGIRRYLNAGSQLQNNCKSRMSGMPRFFDIRMYLGY